MRWLPSAFCALSVALIFGCAAESPSGDKANHGSKPDAVAAPKSDETEPLSEDNAKPRPEPRGEHPHKYKSGPARENRLAKETSPYLLLHKTNPVDWYPWGAEALAKAKRENKLIFLSIGYSSCHWCHVMERESFMNEEIAEVLNEHFVSIKVDREERPDVDDVYMTALHVLRIGGGWPLSMFLTPDAKPIYGGTYFPPKDIVAPNGKVVRHGFPTALSTMREAWQEKPEGVRRQADQVSRLVQENMKSRPAEGDELDREFANKVYESLTQPGSFDSEHGGFGYSAANPDQPKFPEPSKLLFLLDFIERTEDDGKKAHAQRMLTKTLDAMAAGGIWDHLGGGFHRYSVDRFWHIPHFEKMLYDNGQLASVYARAFALTGNTDYRRTVEQIIEFSDREMRDKASSGYFSALDAESDHKEGGFYIWKREAIRDTLEEDEYEIAAAVYNLDAPPNFKDPHSDDTAYVLLRLESLEDLARAQKVTVEELESRLAAVNEKLFKQRVPRKRPLLDTKILTSWNGMMIRGLADAGRYLKNDEYTNSAARTAEFILENLRTEEGRLLRTHTDGEAKLNGYLVDYAFLIDGLIALHEATGDKKWLDEANTLMQKQLQLFADKDGGFFLTSDDHESLFARSKRAHDGARPSGNSVSADNLTYLAKALENAEYREAAKKTILAFAALTERVPSAMPRMAIAASRLLEGQDKQSSDAGDKNRNETQTE